MKQRDAVYQAVINVMGEHEGAYEPSKDQRESIIMIVTEGFVQGNVDFSDSAQAKYNTPTKIKGYVGGLVSNWLRKDPHLNGGVKYMAKNPGSRAGQGDAQLKALRQLAKTLTDPTKVAFIETKINERVAEVRAEKAKSTDIDLSSLPQDLLESLGLAQ